MHSDVVTVALLNVDWTYSYAVYLQPVGIATQTYCNIDAGVIQPITTQRASSSDDARLQQLRADG